MARKIQFDRVVRGVEVTVTAEDFDGDESVGVPIGPETVYAETLSGEPFDLTDDEVETFGIQASESYFNDCDFD
jgi:hypothetical protein